MEVVRFRNTIGEGVNIGVTKKAFQGFEPDRQITLEVAGNVLDLRQSTRNVGKSNVQWLDADHYIDLKTGEIKEAEHSISRGDKMSVHQLRRSFRQMRGIINTNFMGKNGEQNETLITLTYHENMTDPLRLYCDLEKFIKRLKYHVGKIKYVTAVEPQGRGSWHAHILCKQLESGALVDKALINQLWEHGIIVDVETLEEVDNVGAYLTAYLSNTPEDAQANGAEVGKKVKKGNRLHMYPRGMHVYRASRNCNKPTKIKIAPISEEMRAIYTVGSERYSASVDVFAEDINREKSYLLNSLNHQQWLVNRDAVKNLIRNHNEQNKESRELLQALQRMNII